jgi:deoxyribose-phosphate aldolase
MNVAEVKDWIEKAEHAAAGLPASALISVIDLTTLGDLDTVSDVQSLCYRAMQENVGGVCVYPRFVATAKRALEDSPIPVAAVTVDFPHGQAPVSVEAEGVRVAIAAGADEIDMVIRRSDALAREFKRVGDQVSAIVDAAGDAHVKVILETCQLEDVELIYETARHALDAGANFVKTSTGKAEAGATPEAVAALCLAVRDHEAASDVQAGVKPSGGIRTYRDAALYASLAHEIAGIEAGDATRFRIGASSLLETLLSEED